MEDQNKYLRNEFPRSRWNFILAIVGNKTLFNALLYKGSFVKKNIPQSYFQFYNQTFEHLFTHDLARKSFFLQLCLLGEVRYEEGRTIEGKEDAFNTMKNGLNGNLEIVQENCDLIQAVKNHQELDFISMSDVPSYFDGSLEKNFLQDCRPHLSPGAILVVRSYLRVPEADRSGYKDVTEDFKSLIHQEKVGVYNIEVLKNDV